MKYSILDYIKDNKWIGIPLGLVIAFFIYIKNSINNGERGQEPLYYVASILGGIYVVCFIVDYLITRYKFKKEKK